MSCNSGCRWTILLFYHFAFIGIYSKDNEVICEWSSAWASTSSRPWPLRITLSHDIKLSRSLRRDDASHGYIRMIFKAYNTGILLLHGGNGIYPRYWSTWDVFSLPASDWFLLFLSWLGDLRWLPQWSFEEIDIQQLWEAIEYPICSTGHRYVTELGTCEVFFYHNHFHRKKFSKSTALFRLAFT